MQIVIKPLDQIKRHLSVCGNTDWIKGMKQIAGQTIDVDTEYLFDDQYNTPAGTGTDLGLRVMEKDIVKVIDDMRPYRKRCEWCWTHVALVTKECPKCHKSEFRRFTVRRYDK